MDSRVISCHKMDEHRTTVLFVDHLEQEAMELGISHMISAMTTDKGSNMVNVVVLHLE